MKNFKVIASLIISVLSLAFALIDWFNTKPDNNQKKAKQAVRNPNGNPSSLEKARAVKAMKKEENHFLDFDELAELGEKIQPQENG